MTERPTDTADATATFRETREYAQGRLDVDHRDVHPVAGLVQDDEVREVLMFMSEVFEPFDGPNGERISTFWDTEFAKRAIRKYATDTATRAISEGNLTQAAYINGLPSYDSDVSGLHAINQLADWLVHSEQCKLVYLAALMGRGKTDLSLTLLEVIHDHFRRVKRSNTKYDVDSTVPTPEFASNFHVEAPGDVEVRQINHYEDLLDWMEGGSSDEERWFVFDEASSELTAQDASNAQKVVKRMGSLVKKMRKMGVNMIVIGHDKGDVHVAIRSLADFVDKTGLKTASFYAGIKGREPTGHLFDLGGIPPTSWSFDTDDTAEWEWGDEEDSDVDAGMTDTEFKQAVAKRGAILWQTTDVTQEDVAKALSTDGISVSRSMISRAAKELDDPAQAAAAE